MHRKKIVAGNWKMNTTLEEAVELVRGVQAGAKNTPLVEKILFPPFPFLKTVSDLLIEDQDIVTGAQNCSAHERGAYTGEVSAAMLKSVGCSYVLVGHSERRQYFGENSGLLAMKIKQALGHELKVIYCVGEQLSERNAQSHFMVVKSQLSEVLQGLTPENAENIVIAYEPVWAIGTGVTANTTQAQEMHGLVRETLAQIFSKEIASNMPVLYGGSCNAQNAKQLFAEADVDGGLIGGASLKPEEFSHIIRSFS
jgi:triosephosphate isomerase (TIM)